MPPPFEFTGDDEVYSPPLGWLGQLHFPNHKISYSFFITQEGKFFGVLARTLTRLCTSEG
jgi:hypothetical protein